MITKQQITARVTNLAVKATTENLIVVLNVNVDERVYKGLKNLGVPCYKGLHDGGPDAVAFSPLPK